MEEKEAIRVQYRGKEIEGLNLRHLWQGTLITGSVKIACHGLDGELRRLVWVFADKPTENVIAYLDELVVHGKDYAYVELDNLPDFNKGPWGLSPQKSASTWRHRRRGRRR